MLKQVRFCRVSAHNPPVAPHLTLSKNQNLLNSLSNLPKIWSSRPSPDSIALCLFSDLLSSSHMDPATFKYIKYIPAPGPLLLPFPLPGTHMSQISTWLTPSSSSGVHPSVTFSVSLYLANLLRISSSTPHHGSLSLLSYFTFVYSTRTYVTFWCIVHFLPHQTIHSLAVWIFVYFIHYCRTITYRTMSGQLALNKHLLNE